jgi:hypothetical protein
VKEEPGREGRWRYAIPSIDITIFNATATSRTALCRQPHKRAAR